jgi:hypothetical protein
MMPRAFERLRVDIVFRERQTGIATTLFAFLERVHLLSFIGRLPYWLATPMLFETRRQHRWRNSIDKLYLSS